jgi:predicted O-methyltransferase YrrM
VLDDRVLDVLARLETDGASERSREITRTTGQFLFSLVTPMNDCGALELGAGRGYSTIWLAAGVRYFSGRVVSLENDPASIDAWRRNTAAAGLEEWVDLVEGDAFETLPQIGDVFDVVFLHVEQSDYEVLFGLARDKVEPGAVIVAEGVVADADVLGAYSQARQADPTLVSTTVPLDRGLEVSVVLR